MHLQNESGEATEAVDTAAKADTKGTGDAANPITPVPNAEKDCDASPPKAKAANKTIKRKLKVLDTTAVNDDTQPSKKTKLGSEIKTS